MFLFGIYKRKNQKFHGLLVADAFELRYSYISEWNSCRFYFQRHKYRCRLFLFSSLYADENRKIKLLEIKQLVVPGKMKI